MRYLLPLLLLLPLSAFATPITYTINFALESGSVAPTGSFSYDPETRLFVDQLLIDVPITGGPQAPFSLGLHTEGAAPCLNGRTGAEAAFALLSNECPNSRWQSLPASVAYGAFHMYSSVDGYTVELIRFFDLGVNGSPPAGSGTWTLVSNTAPIGVPEGCCPWWLLVLGLGGVVYEAKTRSR